MIYNFEDLSFRFLNAAVYTHPDGEHSVKARRHAALSYRLSGEGRFLIDGKSITVKTGDVVFIPADMEYKVEYSCSQSVVIHLLDCNYFEAEKISVGDRAMIESRFYRLISCRGESYSANRAKACIYDILARLEEGVGIESDPEMRRCLEYLGENFTDPTLTVEELCLGGHISHSTLQRRFKSQLGVTPKQYLTRLRMNKALDMLGVGESTVREISYACGYEDEKYFSRVFKQTFGCPPVQFNADVKA